MRISSNQYRSTLQLAMQNSSSDMADLLQKMSSGKSMLVPSENPIASVRLLRLQREEASLKQYHDNIGALKSQLSKNEALLDGMSASLRDARDWVRRIEHEEDQAATPPAGQTPWSDPQRQGVLIRGDRRREVRVRELDAA